MGVDTTLELIRRGDGADDDNGGDVMLSGSGTSAVGDLAGFRCGMGGACVERLAMVSSCTKRDTSSSCSSRVPGREYMLSKRSAIGVTTPSSWDKDPLLEVSAVWYSA